MNQPDFSGPVPNPKHGPGSLRVGVYFNPASPDASRILHYFHQQGISVSAEEAHLLIQRLKTLQDQPQKKPVPPAEEEGSEEMRLLMKTLLQEVRKEKKKKTAEAPSGSAAQKPSTADDPYSGIKLPSSGRRRR